MKSKSCSQQIINKFKEYKDSKFILFLAVLFISITILSCKKTTKAEIENLKEAKHNVVIATKELSKARLDSVNQYASYRTEMDNRLIENDKNIALIRLDIKNQKKSIKIDLEKNLDVLMAKNETFRVAIKTEKDGIYSKWETFKTDLNINMDDLGKSISEMANKNKNNK